MPPIMGAAMRFITSAPAPVLHMMGASPTNMVATVMTLGRMRLMAPWTIASRRSATEFMPARQAALFVRQFQVEQHEHSRLGIDAHQRDQPHPYADAHVVAQQVEQPDGADPRERHGQQH